MNRERLCRYLSHVEFLERPRRQWRYFERYYALRIHAHGSIGGEVFFMLPGCFQALLLNLTFACSIRMVLFIGKGKDKGNTQQVHGFLLSPR